MKPTKNRIFCNDCGRVKMLFETEKKANNFIKFNHKEIEKESGYAPKRSYFCHFCGGWHTTSIKEIIGMSKNEELLEKYLEEKIIVPNKTEKKRNEIMIELENQIETMDITQMELFFIEKINSLKKEIDDLSNTTDTIQKEQLKKIRQYLDIVYIVRKKKGFQKKKYNHYEKELKKELEEWRLWFEKRNNNKE